MVRETHAHDRHAYARILGHAETLRPFACMARDLPAMIRDRISVPKCDLRIRSATDPDIETGLPAYCQEIP